MAADGVANETPVPGTRFQKHTHTLRAVPHYVLFTYIPRFFFVLTSIQCICSTKLIHAHETPRSASNNRATAMRSKYFLHIIYAIYERGRHFGPLGYTNYFAFADARLRRRRRRLRFSVGFRVSESCSLFQSHLTHTHPHLPPPKFQLQVLRQRQCASVG